MKKVLIITGAVILFILIYMFSFGIQIGNVRLGKQNDLKAQNGKNH